jgi:chaperonin GroEL (HSP60 family)
MIDPSDNTEFVATKLKELGLFGTNSHTKFIPEQYLYSSLETRKQLLQGLLDTDGSKNKRGLYSFSSVNQKLAEQVLELFRGLGRPAVLRKIIKEGKDSYSNNPIYEVSERKGYVHGTKLMSIEPTDKFVEVQCIKVSNEDSLYITEDYIVTHNTTSTTAITSKLVELFINELNNNPELNLHECFTFLEQLKLQSIEYLNANKQVITHDGKGLELIRDIAYTSSHNNDDIANAIKNLYAKLEDWNTDVSFEFNDLDVDTVEMNEGYNINHRANAFSGNRKEFENSRLFVYPDKVDKLPLNFLQYIISKRTKDNSPVVLFAKHFDKAVEAEANRLKDAYGVELYLIRSDTYGESQKTQFEDLCRILNINMLTKEDISTYGRDLEYNEGYLKSLVLTNEECYFVFTEDCLPIKAEITQECQTLIKATKDKALKEMTQNRLKRLQFSKCTYFIGGITTSETANKYYLIEDAILAVKSAIKQGVVHGGCYDYIQLTEHLKKINKNLNNVQSTVLTIFTKSILHPFELQCINSFEDYTERLNKVIETKTMFNFKDRKFYKLENNKIKDSYSTSINCIQNAISIAKVIMLTNHIIY